MSSRNSFLSELFSHSPSVSPVLVEGIGDELGVKRDVRKAIAVLDSADHSRPGNTVAQNRAPAASPDSPTHPGKIVGLTSQVESGGNWAWWVREKQ